MDVHINKSHGFTLIELLITTVVLAILLGFGVPSFLALIENNRLTSQANDFIYAFRMARSEAVKRSAPVRVAAADGSDWRNGWVVLADTNRDGDYADNDDILVQAEPFSGGGSISVNAINATSNLYLAFDPKGSLIPNNSSYSFELQPGNCTKHQARTITVAPSGHTALSHEGCSE